MPLTPTPPHRPLDVCLTVAVDDSAASVDVLVREMGRAQQMGAELRVVPVHPLACMTDASMARDRGWDVARDGDHWRRVVPSPLPRRIVEQELAASLLDQHVTVVCGGGGGAPVVEDQDGILTGVEAVVDKDLVAAMLAVEVGADRLLVLTDVSAVMSDFGTPDERRIARLAAKDLSPDDFAAGSMGPKIGACAGFVRLTGNEAAIGALEDAEAVLHGSAGTTIATAAAFVGSAP